MSSSSIPASWQHAWDNALPQLTRIRQSLAAAPGPSPRIVRVGQLDAELLDQELVQLLKDPLVKALSLVNVSQSLLDPDHIDSNCNSLRGNPALNRN